MAIRVLWTRSACIAIDMAYRYRSQEIPDHVECGPGRGAGSTPPYRVLLLAFLPSVHYSYSYARSGSSPPALGCKQQEACSFSTAGLGRREVGCVIGADGVTRENEGKEGKTGRKEDEGGRRKGKGKGIMERQKERKKERKKGKGDRGSGHYP